jgi:hypothetical protein
VIYSFQVGGVGLFGGVSSVGGSAATITGETVLPSILGALFFNAADSGNYAALENFVIADTQTPTIVEVQTFVPGSLGGLFVVTNSNSQQAALETFLGV